MIAAEVNGGWGSTGRKASQRLATMCGPVERTRMFIFVHHPLLYEYASPID